MFGIFFVSILEQPSTIYPDQSMRHSYITDLLEDESFLKSLRRSTTNWGSKIPIAILRQWKKQLILNDTDLFSEMLNNYGLDEETFKSVLHYYFTAPKDQLFLKRDSAINNMERVLFSEQYKTAPIFLNVFSEILNEVHIRIKTRQTNAALKNIDKNTLDLLNKHLYNSFFLRILDISTETFDLERKVLEEKELLKPKGENNKQDFESEFLSDRVFGDYLFEEYPVLFRIIKEEADKFVDNTAQFISRLDKDFVQILQLTGYPKNKITGLDGNIGYARKNGKSAFIIRFEKGSDVVYKPWSMKMQSVFGDFIVNLSTDFQNPLFMPSVILKEHYGWIEFMVEARKSSHRQVLRNCNQIGVLLAIGYVLDATDFHLDNIVFTEKGAMLIDCETLFHPEEFIEDHSEIKPGLSRNDVSKTGLFYRIDTSHHFFRNLLTSKKAMESLVSGFIQCYNYCMDNKQSLFEQLSTKFKDSKIRVVLRDNQIYDHLCKQRLKPETLTDGYKSDMLFEWLWGLVNEFPYLKKVIIHEKRSILNNEVPIFTAQLNSKDIHFNEKTIVENMLHYSPREILQDKLYRLNDIDLNKQILLIKNSLDQIRDQWLANGLEEPIQPESSM